MTATLRAKMYLLCSATIVFACPAYAQNDRDANDHSAQAPAADLPQAPAQEVFSTGVARGRDILDSAISTSALQGDNVTDFGVMPLASILQMIPGVRAEPGSGDADLSVSIRGLPLQAIGVRYVQLQEDGLPVLEYGDNLLVSSGNYVRFDSSVAAIETIRGGSASTFVSNAPGGIINLMSKTGVRDGGSIRATTDIGDNLLRADFDYGRSLGNGWRFHLGGYYRHGEGPRDAGGLDLFRGGQVKFNVTKELSNGYVRLYAKYLDEHSPNYSQVPLLVSGTDSKPKFRNIPGLNANSDFQISPNVDKYVLLNEKNEVERRRLSDGINPVVKYIGLESKLSILGVDIFEKFRFSKITGNLDSPYLGFAASGAMVPSVFGLTNGVTTYATGPNAGQAFPDNGWAAGTIALTVKLDSLDNITNDIKASKVWNIGSDVVTTTAGFYVSRQDYRGMISANTLLQSVEGGGKSQLLNLSTDGQLLTDNGVIGYGNTFANGAYHRLIDVKYSTYAPYGSINYSLGDFSIGASVRYDMQSTKGQLTSCDLGGGRACTVSSDVNGDGVISIPETRVSNLPLSQPAPVDFSYHYFSYSSGANYRISDNLAIFARYSKGGHGNSGNVLFTPAVSSVDGSLQDSASAFATVKQVEGGVKFRKRNFAAFVTGFSAKTSESSMQPNASGATITVDKVDRKYSSYGVELEGRAEFGDLSFSSTATWSSAKIESDTINPSVDGNPPRHQPKLIYAGSVQYNVERFSLGANVVGTTKSYASDTRQLVMPGYTAVNLFGQVRVLDDVEVSLQANNIFDDIGITAIESSTIPSSGAVLARTMTGRTVSASVRYSF